MSIKMLDLVDGPLIDFRILTVGLLTRKLVPFLLEIVKTHKIHNVAFVSEDDKHFYMLSTEESDASVLPGCVHLMDLSFLDMRVMEHMHPEAITAADLALYISNIYDTFPALETAIDNAFSEVTEAF